MTIITIQNIKVLKTLQDNKIHYADLSYLPKDSNLRNPYERMMKHYNYSHAPIFGCVIGRYAEFYGADAQNGVILELEVPDKLVKLQSYYDWTDVIYFIEYSDEWIGASLPLDEFIVNTLDGYRTNENHCVIQAVIPYIHPEWLKHSYPVSQEFTMLYYGSGGKNILQETNFKERSICHVHCC